MDLFGLRRSAANVAFHERNDNERRYWNQQVPSPTLDGRSNRSSEAVILTSRGTFPPVAYTDSRMMVDAVQNLGISRASLLPIPTSLCISRNVNPPRHRKRIR